MKVCLFASSLVFYVIANTQSMGLVDLTNLTVLNDDQVNDYFVAGKTFKLQLAEEVDGLEVNSSGCR